MTKTCVVCKKQPIPYDNSRSFHKFPVNQDLKQKWMCALGVSSITSNSRVCSDHFDSFAYHQTDGYTTLKRLLSTAVPSKEIHSSQNLVNSNTNSMRSQDADNSNIVLNKSHDVEYHHNNSTEDVTVNNYTLDESCDVECFDNNRLEDNINKSEISLDDSKEKEVYKKKSATMDSSNINLKRKRSTNDTGSNMPTKKFRYLDGSQTNCISREDFVSDEAWNRFLKFVIYKNKQIATVQKKCYRRKKKINNFKELVSKLEEKEASAAAEYLKDLPQHVKELIDRMKNKKPTSPFPSHLKTFARTLHFHSPAAYEMVRRSSLRCLPCVETLNRWNCSKNYSPGICEEVIKHVSNITKNELKKGRRLVFNITFDEINIKKWAFYCQKTHEWKGLVDLGGQLLNVDESGKTQKATKALVFMLVNINGGFKTPVAYYFTNSLSGSETSILLKDLLVKLHENDINVVSVTFDGDESNQRACKILGANFDYTNKKTFKPYFNHPATSKPVYVFFDPCHMLKLVRNYFALKGPLIYNKTSYIDWRYIQKLNEKQYTEGMHCACKIRNRHVNFSNEKMKVFLAAQVLNSSTSLALNFLENDLHDPEFEGASATSEFCKIFNDIFYLLNTKNKFCKTPGKKAITKESLSELKQKTNEFISYVEKLDVEVRKKYDLNKLTKEQQEIEQQYVLKSTSVTTGFLGFIICLENLYHLCKMLFEEDLVDYFLTYKLSQDHVEMFFALIRRMNGFANNPTTVQFQSAYKKLLLNNMNVTVPASANCTPQDNTFIISSDNDYDALESFLETDEIISNKTSAKTKRNNKLASSLKSNPFAITDLLHSNYNLLEHDYVKNETWIESEYLNHIIKHTAGSVVYSIKQKIHCDVCLNMLNGVTSNKLKLSIIKNRGGLNFASDDINLICECTEKIIRRHKNSLLSPKINVKLVTDTMKILPPFIFNNSKHILEQEPLFDHRQQLIYLVIQNYIDKRLKYESIK